MIDILSFLFASKRDVAFTKVKTLEKRAREIMGTNFFGVRDAMQYFKIRPSKKQLEILSKIPFSDTLLKKYRESHYLVAVFPLSIFDIRRRVDKNLFEHGNKFMCWWNDRNERFMKSRGDTGWYLIRKSLVPGSTCKRWSDQQNLLTKDEKTPSARVIVYFVIGYYLARRERLFPNDYGRCSDINSEGYRVDIGLFSPNYLGIGRNTDDFRCCYIGLTSSIVPE